MELELLGWEWKVGFEMYCLMMHLSAMICLFDDVPQWGFTELTLSTTNELSLSMFKYQHRLGKNIKKTLNYFSGFNAKFANLNG